MIHIASHYVAHPHEPGSGRLQLADGDWISIDATTSAAAGVQLLFLASCESGAPTDAGDGWVLDGTHPWRSAGVESVVASLWRISDVHTPALASCFYGQLFAGATRAAALASAQRDLIAENDKLVLSERFIEPTNDPMPPMVVKGAHPRIWSGFRLTGEGGPIHH